MTVAERLADISKRSGFSEKIVRSILDAERESVIDSLKRGERATLIGRCTLTPFRRSRYLNLENRHQVYVKVKAEPSSIIKSELEAVEQFESGEDEQETYSANIAVRQLSSLL